MMLRMNTAAWCSHQNYYCTKKYNVGWDSLGIRVITLGIISDNAKDDAAQCNTFHRLRLINCVISAVSLSIFDDFYVIFQSYPAYACEPIKKQCDIGICRLYNNTYIFLLCSSIFRSGGGKNVQINGLLLLSY